MTIVYQDSSARMSQIVIHNNTVYLAGQVPSDPTADMRAQTEQVLEKVDALLSQAGTSKENLISAQIWVNDMSQFDQMNAAWDAWVVPGRPPVRAATEAKLAKPEWKVEIMVIAALPES
ncbi:MAG TPA: RidA family protein [Candidatus Halomonas stercoripullorum]|uniref:RidA family protein n=1 Tax=Candidatus Halomonas stercoripullorum TaxID=2838617 RepID=A0A9D2B4V3_9GAMM|nr:RidA family protein [Candidatus Halomonas stercoripullorum]